MHFIADWQLIKGIVDGRMFRVERCNRHFAVGMFDSWFGQSLGIIENSTERLYLLKRIMIWWYK